MKKLFVMLLSGLFVLGIAASAMAEVAINGSYRARLWYANNYNMVEEDVDDPGTFIDNRLRTLLDIKVADNVQVFGNFDITERRFGGQSTDVNYQNFQVNEGYLKFMVPATPVWFQVGRQDVTWFYGVLGAYSDYRDRIKVWADLKDIGLNVGAAMDQTIESLSTPTPDDDDSSAYSVWARAKVVGWDLGGILVIADNKINDTNLSGVTTPKENESQTYAVGFGANGAAGPVKLGFEGAYKFGTTKTRAAGSGAAWTEKDLSAFGALAIASAPVGPVGLTLAVAYASGDDITTADKNEGLAFDTDGPVNGVLLWANNWAPEVVPLAGTYAADSGFGAITGGGNPGGIGVKVAASFSPVKPLTLGLAALYAIAAQDPTATVDAGPYGAEVDVTCSYDIAPSVNVLLAGGFLSPGSMLKDLGFDESAIGGVIKFEVKF